jgi:hypothetical protein
MPDQSSQISERWVKWLTFASVPPNLHTQDHLKERHNKLKEQKYVASGV